MTDITVPQETAGDGPFILFHHIPRTGGNSLREYLKQNMDGEDVVINNGEGAQEFGQLPRTDKMHHRLISGHLFVGAILDLPQRYELFTMLRHPVERVASVYSWIMGGHATHGVGHMMVEQGWSFRDFLTSHDGRVLSRVHSTLRYLGGPMQGDGLWGMAERAIQTLLTEFSFVGLLEEYPRCVEYLNRRYGFTGKAEAQNGVPRSNRVTEQDLSMARKALEPEIAAYEFMADVICKRFTDAGV